MKNIKYSVLMSVYYKEKPEYLQLSINSMLNQTVKPDEIILVKDGALTYELETVINSFSEQSILKVIPLASNVGLGKALNIGLEMCKNELVARMDADDISRKERCEKQLKLFLEDEKLSIVSSSILEFEDDIHDLKSIKLLPTNHEEILTYAKKRNPFNHPSVMFKKSIVTQAGGYKHFELFEDYYLWIRMIMNGAKCCNIKEPLLYMRANSNMYSRRGGLSYIKYMLRFKNHLRRKGFITLYDFLISISAQGIVALLPNTFRMKIYDRFLRIRT